MITIIPKRANDPTKIKGGSSINMLPTLSKLFDKLLLKNLTTILQMEASVVLDPIVIHSRFQKLEKSVQNVSYNRFARDVNYWKILAGGLK